MSQEQMFACVHTYIHYMYVMYGTMYYIVHMRSSFLGVVDKRIIMR